MGLGLMQVLGFMWCMQVDGAGIGISTDVD